MKMSSQLFVPSKQPPANADTVNHRLLVQAGFVRQTMAGVYTYTTLGLRVLEQIAQVIRHAMLDLGSQEIHMPALLPAEPWRQSGGWDNIDVLFKIKSQTGRDYALGQSHEEIVTPLLAEVIRSYKDLPKSVFQIQWKYRDELRAKSGILRGREFYMKDMYSWHATHEDFLAYYERVKRVYLDIFRQLGLTAKATQASGGNFSDKISYEFMVLTDAGEDDIRYCQQCDYCINSEIAPSELTTCPQCGAPLQAGRASEAGNIFDLGQRFTKIFDLRYTDEHNQQHYPYMGCYGIGVSRCMGIIVEKCHDARGIIWPLRVAPAHFYLVGIGEEGTKVAQVWESIFNDGEECPDLSAIVDDRDVSPGAKFAAADLIGCPYRLVWSPKVGEGYVEVKARDQQTTWLITNEQLLQFGEFMQASLNWLSRDICTDFLNKLSKNSGK